MELKTLKVIESEIMSNTKLCKQNWLQQTATVIATIKEELGIKKIKKLEEEKSICSFQDERSLTYIQLCGNIMLLKEIFNITEKDLK